MFVVFFMMVYDLVIELSNILNPLFHKHSFNVDPFIYSPNLMNCVVWMVENLPLFDNKLEKQLLLVT